MDFYLIKALMYRLKKIDEKSAFYLKFDGFK